MNKTHKLLVAVCCLFFYSTVAAQEDEMYKMPLEDLSAFEPQAGNWQIVADVTMDPTVDIHHEEEPKKKKGKKKNRDVPEPVSRQPGTGVLVNLPTDDQKDNLVTVWKHGDIEIELEVMLPKGSNSGLYLQGRYEVQLFDSWGVKTARFSDIGGIYRNWESDPDKSYMGKAPLVNAAKAPGLWQKLKIAFQAPRFNKDGNKTANARILFAELNGVRIHENIELPKPTGGPLENNEVEAGPIMIQGDHGAVAFRNIRYKHMRPSGVSVTDLSYEVHHGEFESVEAVLNSPVANKGKIDLLTYEVADRENEFGVVYSGTVNIPEGANYIFSGRAGGSVLLTVNNEQVFSGWRSTKGTIYLEEGTYPFELVYFKSTGWVSPMLAFTVATANTYPRELHALSSAPPGGTGVSPILVEPGSQARLLRAFLDFKGDKNQRLTHTIGVGEPSGIHYIYDLSVGNLVCAWKGPFVDATPMWHDRGDGSFRPLGMTQYLFTGPALSVLSDMNQPFNENTVHFKSKGYTLDTETAKPTFLYMIGNTEVSDQIQPDLEAKFFTRKVLVENPAENMYLKVAEGSKVEELPNGWYAIDDKRYYITLLSDHKSVIREMDGRKELLIVVDTVPIINYSLTW